LPEGVVESRDDLVGVCGVSNGGRRNRQQHLSLFFARNSEKFSADFGRPCDLRLGKCVGNGQYFTQAVHHPFSTHANDFPAGAYIGHKKMKRRRAKVEDGDPLLGFIAAGQNRTS
jgi:hypothetical protein